MNCIELILHIIYFKNKDFINLNINYCSIDEICAKDFNSKIFAIAFKDSDAWIKNDLIVEINNLNNFIFSEENEFSEQVDEMILFENELDVSKYTFLCIPKLDKKLIEFEKFYNDAVKIYNSLNLNERSKLLSDNCLSDDMTIYKLKTTYFEILTSPQNKKVKNYLKVNNLKINFEQFLK